MIPGNERNLARKHFSYLSEHPGKHARICRVTTQQEHVRPAFPELLKPCVPDRIGQMIQMGIGDPEQAIHV